MRRGLFERTVNSLEHWSRAPFCSGEAIYSVSQRVSELLVRAEVPTPHFTHFRSLPTPLRCLPRVDKQDDTMSQQVLSLFLTKLNLKDMHLDDALRKMVLKFRMPGEAQQIDR